MLHFDPAYARKSYLPIVNNVFDIGSSTYQFATVFAQSLSFNSSIKIKPSHSEVAQFDSTGIRTNLTSFRVYTNTGSGSDNSMISISGSGDPMNSSRSAWLSVSGNQSSGAGALSLVAGNISTGYINLMLSNSSGLVRYLNSSSAVMWNFANDGSINQNSSNGGNIILNKTGSTLMLPATLAISAAGSDQSGATALTDTVNQVTTCTAGQGVKLKDAATKEMQIVCNMTTAPLKVYPASSDAINGLASNAHIVLNPGQSAFCVAFSSSQWAAIIGGSGSQAMMEGGLSGASSDGTYVLTTSARYAFKINSIQGLKSTSGTCSFKVQINGVDVTSITGLSVTSTPQNVTATGANTVAIGDTITFIVSSASSLNDLFFTLDTTRI